MTRSEVARALRALSSCYVERRTKLASGAALEGAGKRAAFALFYGPLHFATIDNIVRASGLASLQIHTIHDLGCGTGVGGAAWALACDPHPRVEAIDRSAWAVEEANWTYAQLAVRGRARRADLARVSPPIGKPTKRDALLFAYAANELPDATRATLLQHTLEALGAGTALLIVEPIGRRLGNAGWWDEWKRALEPHGVLEEEWRFPNVLPEGTRDLARAAGLDPRELTARTLKRG